MALLLFDFFFFIFVEIVINWAFVNSLGEDCWSVTDHVLADDKEHLSTEFQEICDGFLVLNFCFHVICFLKQFCSLFLVQKLWGKAMSVEGGSIGWH